MKRFDLQHHSRANSELSARVKASGNQTPREEENFYDEESLRNPAVVADGSSL
jgi:hypothetical protein